jgi:Raf kinase inhibitor-like YbhB/YbcL family protein
MKTLTEIMAYLTFITMISFSCLNMSAKADVFIAIGTGGIQDIYHPTGIDISSMFNSMPIYGISFIAESTDGTVDYKEANDYTKKTLPGIPLLLLGTDTFSLESNSFSHSEPIPEKHSLNGNNLSPPLFWSNAPADTQGFVLIMDDPDAPAGTWDHWIVYDIPAGTTSIAEDAGASGGGNLPAGAKPGTNSWGNNYYQGPSPPSGTHRYYFKLYALSVSQLNPSDTSKPAIEAAMSGKILDQAELVGTYTHSL